MAVTNLSVVAPAASGYADPMQFRLSVIDDDSTAPQAAGPGSALPVPV